MTEALAKLSVSDHEFKEHSHGINYHFINSELIEKDINYRHIISLITVDIGTRCEFPSN